RPQRSLPLPYTTLFRSQAANTRGQLPMGLTSFVGREVALSQLATYLTDPSCRLLTLVGSGGIGKTRLAIEAARQSKHHFVDGIQDRKSTRLNSSHVKIS